MTSRCSSRARASSAASRGESISPDSVLLLRRLGVLEALTDQPLEVHRMRVHDGGRQVLSVDFAEFPYPERFPIELAQPSLLSALATAAAAHPNFRLVRGARVLRILDEDDGKGPARRAHADRRARGGRAGGGRRGRAQQPDAKAGGDRAREAAAQAGLHVVQDPEPAELGPRQLQRPPARRPPRDGHPHLSRHAPRRIQHPQGRAARATRAGD